jgi:hypothetical protein
LEKSASGDGSDQIEGTMGHLPPPAGLAAVIACAYEL